MEKSMGITLMITFLVSGVAAAALAWLVPSLHISRTLATAAGFIGVGFTVYQVFHLRRLVEIEDEPESIPVAIETDEKS